MKKLLKLVAILGVVASITSGCAVNRATGSVDPSADLSALKTMYVKRIPEETGGTNVLIADSGVRGLVLRPRAAMVSLSPPARNPRPAM